MITPVAVIATDSTLQYINPAGALTLGQERGWLMGRRMLDLVHPDDRHRVDVELRMVVSGRPISGTTRYRLRANPAREWRLFESTVDNLLDDPRVGGILVSSRDVTDEVAQQVALRSAAFTHSLTGLPNRSAIDKALREITDAHGDEEVAVGFVGVERLQLVRQSLGQTATDALLRIIANRCRAAVASTHLVGQIDSETFVVVITGAAVGEAMEILWRVVHRVSEPIFIEAHELVLSASAGLVVPEGASTAEGLLDDAALALHYATTHGGGRVVLFDPGFRRLARVRLEMEANLRQAFANDDLWIALQPIVALPDATPVRAEVLLRWDCNGTAVPPDEFITIAEETGLIIPIGDRVIDAAARIAVRAPGGQLLVNLSPRQLASPRLVERIDGILRSRHVAPHAIGFEVTETLLIEHFDYAADTMSRIRELGCPVGLDDFGTGYSSLSYLRRLPLDFIKIDGTLTQGIDTSPEARSIVGSVIDLAGALHLDVIAEGVETPSEAATLSELGCSHAQGYLFGRPSRPE
ncbi:MAG: putative bifunctional diguanylate cyclase/phosphodiesterase [Acidimicrobiales bacterium]